MLRAAGRSTRNGGVEQAPQGAASSAPTMTYESRTIGSYLWDMTLQQVTEVAQIATGRETQRAEPAGARGRPPPAAEIGERPGHR